jgi:sugar phosphate isomerase/epimerase
VPALVDGTGKSVSKVNNGADIQALARLLDEQRVQASALLLATDFAGPQAADHRASAINAVKVAQALGAPVIRLDPLTHNNAVDINAVRDAFIAEVRQVLAATVGSGVDFGIENHGVHGNTPQFLDAIFAAVGDPRLGMTLDTGNFYWSGMALPRLYEVLQHFAPLARHTHVKNIAYPADIAARERETGYEYGRYCIAVDEGNIDMARVIGMLRDAGYKRTLCIENESLGRYEFAERSAILRREGAYLRSLIGQTGGHAS